MKHGRYSDALGLAASLHGRVMRSMIPRVEASLIFEMTDMAEENRRLKLMYAEVNMQNDLLKEALGNSAKAILQARDGHESGSKARRQYRAGLLHVRDQ